MAPKYKLYYFNMGGRGEPIRYLFAYANKEFEDCRLKREEWASLKPNTPLGGLPVLEIDGTMYPQSGAISRYLSKQFGLFGKDDFEAFQIDIVLDTFGDVQSAVMKEFFEKDDTKKAEAEKQRNFYLTKLEESLTKNGSGFFVGSQVTAADIIVAANLSSLKERKADVLTSFPNLTKLVDIVNSFPQIKSYLEKRPKSDPLPQRK